MPAQPGEKLEQTRCFCSHWRVGAADPNRQLLVGFRACAIRVSSAHALFSSFHWHTAVSACDKPCPVVSEGILLVLSVQ